MGSYFVKPKIYMERESLREILAGASKALIVTDKFMHESGKVSYLTEPLQSMGVTCEIFSEVKPDPDIVTVTNGLKVMASFKPDAILALGGGSSIDCAKAMNYLSWQQGFTEKCRFVAVPTTSGTGSEVTTFAVISDPEKAAKYPLISDDLLPDAAILDAHLTVSVPKGTTADTGMDVLTHAYEALVSKNANDFTDATAEKAVRLVCENLPKVYRTPDDLEARQKMHNASCMAGMAFSNAGLGLNHGMAHTLGGHFHIPHGKANAVLLPYVMEYNSGIREELTSAAPKYAKMAALVGKEAPNMRQSVTNIIRWTKDMNELLGVPRTIAALGISKEAFEDALPDMVKAALADACTATNPRNATEEEVKLLFQSAYEGRYLVGKR